jgi:predicted DNA-binding protein YlxM (UPF0122 family)
MPTVPKELKNLVPPRRIEKGKRRKRITESQRTILKKEFLKEYRKDDTALSKTAEKVGFSRQVIYKWAEADPEFAKEFEELRFIKKGKTKKQWEKKHGKDEEYKKKFLELYADDNYSVSRALITVSEKLTNSDLAYWLKTDTEFKMSYKILQQKIHPTQTKGSKIRSVINSAKIQQRQNKFLEIFTTQHFNITNACKEMGIKRHTITSWCNKDPDFKAAMDVAQDEKEDWVEDKLFQLIEEGNMVATIFASKIMLQQRNLGRRHAYIEQPQKIEGHIRHTHEFNQDQLDAMVRGQKIDRNKYENMLQLDDPTIVDAEYTE